MSAAAREQLPDCLQTPWTRDGPVQQAWVEACAIQERWADLRLADRTGAVTSTEAKSTVLELQSPKPT